MIEYFDFHREWKAGDLIALHHDSNRTALGEILDKGNLYLVQVLGHATYIDNLYYIEKYIQAGDPHEHWYSALLENRRRAIPLKGT